MGGEASPNDVLIPCYEGEEIVYVTPPEYYLRLSGILGSVAIKKEEETT